MLGNILRKEERQPYVLQNVTLDLPHRSVCWVSPHEKVIFYFSVVWQLELEGFITKSLSVQFTIWSVAINFVTLILQ